MNKLIDGKAIANGLLTSFRNELASLPFTPILCDVMVGHDPVSMSFVGTKRRQAEAAGLAFQLIQLEENTPVGEIVRAIQEAAAQPNVSGLIVQLPLPSGIELNSVLSAIPEHLDVDCLNPFSQEKFYSGHTLFLPPTAAAIMTIVDTLELDLSAQSILLLGQGQLVGRPVAELLRRRGLSFQTADKTTKDVDEKIRSATIIISGVGKHGVINAGNTIPGVTVIDAGTSESEGEIKGDLDISGVESKPITYTPVPGGVGPLSVAMLIGNVLQSARSLIKS